MASRERKISENAHQKMSEADNIYKPRPSMSISNITDQTTRVTIPYVQKVNMRLSKVSYPLWHTNISYAAHCILKVTSKTTNTTSTIMKSYEISSRTVMHLI